MHGSRLRGCSLETSSDGSMVPNDLAWSAFRSSASNMSPGSVPPPSGRLPPSSGGPAICKQKVQISAGAVSPGEQQLAPFATTLLVSLVMLLHSADQICHSVRPAGHVLCDKYTVAAAA